MLYLISYDAHKDRQYDRLYELMDVWEARPLLDSVWLAQLVGPAEVVRDHIRAALDDDDSVAVIEIAPDAQWATRFCRKVGVRWLEEHIPFRR